MTKPEELACRQWMIEGRRRVNDAGMNRRVRHDARLWWLDRWMWCARTIGVSEANSANDASA